MRRKLVPLLTVFALLLVAAGGAAAAGDAGTNIGSTPDETNDGDVGVCLVGADSPCNDAPADDAPADDAPADDAPADGASDGEQIDSNDSDDGQMRIPEDQNGDGEIDDRFRGGDEDADAGICLVGADSPCNDAPTDAGPANGSAAPHPTPVNDSTEIGSDDGESQIWIPEDQNRDGEIDDRFTASLGPFADLAFPLLGGF